MENILSADQHQALYLDGWVWNIGKDAHYAYNKESDARVSGKLTEKFLFEKSTELLTPKVRAYNNQDILFFLRSKGYELDQTTSKMIAIDKELNVFEGSCFMWLLKELGFPPLK